MTILERIRPERRVNQFGRIAKDLMNRDQVKDIRDAAADAIDAVQQLAADAAERAGEAVGDAVESLGSEASKATSSATRDVARAAKGGSTSRWIAGWTRWTGASMTSSSASARPSPPSGSPRW